MTPNELRDLLRLADPQVLRVLKAALLLLDEEDTVVPLRPDLLSAADKCVEQVTSVDGVPVLSLQGDTTRPSTPSTHMRVNQVFDENGVLLGYVHVLNLRKEMLEVTTFGDPFAVFAPGRTMFTMEGEWVRP